MIDITGVDLLKLAKAAYRLSQAQGMGFLHFVPGDMLPQHEEAIQAMIEKLARQTAREYATPLLDLDYVCGRAVKLTVFRQPDGKVTINDSWFDHTDEQLNQLLAEVGVTREA